MTVTDTALSAGATDAVIAAPDALKKTSGKYVEIDVKLIITKAGDNIRSGELPEIENLAASIEAEGLIEPIIITAAADAPGKYSVVAGHRRLTAVRSLGYGTIAALIIDADADRKLRLALIENVQREDMNPVDKARAIQKIMANTEMEQGDVASALGITPGFVSQYLGILALPEAALIALQDEDISFTHARVLCKLLPNMKAIEDLLFDAATMTAAALDAKVTHLAATTEPEETEETEEAEGTAPKKTKAKKKAAVPDKAVEYYEKADFHPMKKEEIRDLMMSYKRKEINADTDKKREEYRLILKGITLAAALRLK